MGYDMRLGQMVRDVRTVRGLRQSDVAERAGVSREAISRLERGDVDGMTVHTLRAISSAMRMPPLVSLGWRTPEVDRLRDRVHAAMVDAMVRRLIVDGWQATPELSFSRPPESGSIDVLGWHPGSGAILIVEVKSRIWDVQDTLSTLDRKRRLGPTLASGELGRRVATVGVLLVMPDSSSNRQTVLRHDATFRAALPDRRRSVGEWLQSPSGPLRGILFLPTSHQDVLVRGRRRVTAVRATAAPQNSRGGRVQTLASAGKS